MCLKAYLKLTEDRLTWAFLADALIEMNIPKSAGQLDKDTTRNTFLQTYVGSEENPIGLFRRQSTGCLIRTHEIKTIADLMRQTKQVRINNNNQVNNHLNRKNCKCKPCKEDRRKGCKDTKNAQMKHRPSWTT